MADLVATLKRQSAVAFMAALLAACSDAGCPPTSESAPARGVSWYLANPDERAATLAACRDDPGGALLDADCLNARAAANRRAFDPANKAMPNPWRDK